MSPIDRVEMSGMFIVERYNEGEARVGVEQNRRYLYVGATSEPANNRWRRRCTSGGAVLCGAQDASAVRTTAMVPLAHVIDTNHHGLYYRCVLHGNTHNIGVHNAEAECLTVEHGRHDQHDTCEIKGAGMCELQYMYALGNPTMLLRWKQRLAVLESPSSAPDPTHHSSES